MEINSTVIAIGSWAVGFVSAILVKFGDGFIKEFFSNRTETKALKRKLGQELMEICIEGANCGYENEPGSQRYIQLKAAEIETFNPTAASKLQKYLSVWVLGCNMEPGKWETVGSVENSKYKSENRKTAQDLGEELLVVAREWKK